MTRSLQRIFPSIALALAILTPLGTACAQDAKPAREKSAKVRLTFLLLHGSYEGTDLYLTGGKGTEAIGSFHVHGSDFSEPVAALPGLYHLVPDPQSADSKKKKPLCVIDIRETKPRKLHVILEPYEKRFKPHFVNPADRKFKVNSTRFFNTTDVPVATELGSVKSVVPAHGNVISAAPPRGNLPYYEVSFYYQQADGTPRKFKSTRWPFRARGRNYSFFYVNPVTNTLSCKTVEEIVPPKL